MKLSRSVERALPCSVGEVLREALQGLASEPARSPDEIVVIGIEAPAVRADLLLERFGERACVSWLPPSGAAFVGIGVAQSIESSGPERFSQIQRAGTALLARLRVHRATDTPLSIPRLFGGFAFDAHGATSDAWRGFGAARFVLPRVTYAVHAERALLSLALDRRELSRAAEQVQLFESAYAALSEPLRAPTSRVARCTGRLEPVPGDFHAQVEDLVRRIALGEMCKAVAARQIVLDFAQPLSPAGTLIALRDQGAECTRFSFQAEGACFVGATPERLLQKRGRQLSTEALAGTVDAGAESPECWLRGSAKELEEHRWVVQAIAGALSPRSVACEVPEQPSIRRLKGLLHLSTPIRARLRGSAHVVELLESLHPTPAVGGVPTELAVDWIRRSEAFDRGWYSGAVGWFDAQGDGDFNVALRSGLMRDTRAWLYAGAGIVKESIASAEYRETTLKLSALLGSLRSQAPSKPLSAPRGHDPCRTHKPSGLSS